MTSGNPPSVREAARIWIVGPPGSGKSTLAARIAAILGVPPTHMDELHWLPGWIERPAQDTAARVAEVVRRDRWVFDGNYGMYRDPHFDRIALTVWLDLPLRITFPRLVRRCLRRSLRREDCCNGNRESLRRTFLHRESLLLYALQTHRHRRRELQDKLAARPHVRLTRPHDIERWMEAQAASART